MPLLSIIIPTHERAQYAVQTVRALLHGLPDTAEIVVSDTSAEDQISHALGDDRQNPRLTFVRPGRSMNVVEHFNFALGHATGDYLCFIGDDDFVLPDLVDIAAWAKERSVDAVKMTFPVQYYWPDFQHKTRGEYYSGSLHISVFSGQVRRVDAARAMRTAAQQLGTGVGEMPRAYAGVVSNALIQRAVARHGALFGGVSPDIYSAALISSEAKLVYQIDYPAIVPGASQASTAGQSASGGHVGKLRENAHIGAFRDLVWDDLIPEFYSVPTVWSYSLMRAAPAVPELSRYAGYGRLYVKCLLWHRSYRAETLVAIRHYQQKFGTAKLVGAMATGLIHEAGWIGAKLWQRAGLRLRPSRSTIIGDLPDSAAGIGASVEYTSGEARQKLAAALEIG
ncbi:glycosyltransferase [Devosia sp. MC1541]|uniref:glycosyltransferase family 2 protein n=1 Tax=Devosia sp. MC1541 TaxID=2725264 RepID=UPI00145CF7BF|nr:glycosyltransferase [Devosia sp. MC1541]